VFCNACGYENPHGHRFCGMCGTPLPQRPLTTPGAHSTANLTTTLPDPGHGAGSKKKLARSQVVTAESPKPPEAAPAGEMVPDLSLEDYISQFHYVPPSSPDELTMTGETPVEEPDSVSASEPVAEGAPPATEAEAPADSGKDIRERLGLDPAGPAEEPVQRTRFLEISEPASEPEGRPPVTPPPSFLEVAEPAEIPHKDAPAVPDENPSRGIWRVWLAAAVVAVFAVLGVMEWRSQVNGTNDGPIQVLRAKIRDLEHGGLSGGAPSQSASTSSANNGTTAPEEQTKSVATSQTEVAPPQSSASSGAASVAQTASPGAGPSPRTSAAAGSAPGSQPSASAGASPSSSQSKPSSGAADTTGTTSTPAATTSSAPAATNEVPPKKPTPGTEEMAKARNASDTGAEAAWLWKATAKGNPDAPVMLADLYVKGDGVPRSCEQAMVLLKTAADKENLHARNRLASMYAAGTCVPRNRVQAYRWFSAALTADPNNSAAQQSREQLWQQMTPEEQTQAQKYR